MGLAATGLQLVPGRALLAAARARCAALLALSCQTLIARRRPLRATPTSRAPERARLRAGRARSREPAAGCRAPALAGAQPAPASQARGCSSAFAERLPDARLRRDRLQRRRAARPPAPAILAPRLARAHGRAGAVRVRAPASANYAALDARRRSRTRRSPDATGDCPSTTCVDADRGRARTGCPTGTTASARSRARRVLGHAAHIPDIAERLVEREVPSAHVRRRCCAAHGVEQHRPAADRHRGLRLGDPAHDRPRRPPPAAARSTSTTTSRRRPSGRCRAHLRAARLRDDGGGLRHVLPAHRRRRRAAPTPGAGSTPGGARASPPTRTVRIGTVSARVRSCSAASRREPLPELVTLTDEDRRYLTTLYDDTRPAAAGRRRAPAPPTTRGCASCARRYARSRPAGRSARRAGARTPSRRSSTCATSAARR